MKSRFRIRPGSLSRYAWRANAAIVMAGCCLASLPLSAGEPAYPDAFDVCTSCHSYREHEALLVGPPLWGVVGRPVASVAGYEYSPALKSVGGTWDLARLDLFLAKPQAFAPGTKMDMGGIPGASDRAEVLEFLRTLAAGKPAANSDDG